MKALQNETHHTIPKSHNTMKEKNLTIFVISFGKDPAINANNSIINTKGTQ
jgi:hypothetical protein